MKKKIKEKRISFSKYDAIHLYEYIRFYWEDYFLRNPKDRKKHWRDEEGMDKFGNCPQCQIIGKRLEEFIGEKDKKWVDKLIREHRKKLLKPK